MAGLLDTIFGDAETKDELGTTERERRAPLWAGLTRAGLLAYAGGGNLMPEDRAKYYAEAGGALAGIPADFVKAGQEHAQAKLSQQKLGEGKRKEADRQRIQAMAQTPEFLAMIKDAKGPDRLAIQLAIEAGDIGALNTAVGNLDKTALGTARLDAATAKLEAAKAAGGAYKGNAIEAQHHENLKTKPIDSYEYYMAHQYFSTEQKNAAGGTIGKVDLSRFPDPTYVDPRTGRPPAPTVPGQPTVPPEVKPDTPMTPEVVQQIAKDLKPGEEKIVNGVTIEKDRGGIVSWDTGSDTKEGSRYKMGPKGPELQPKLKPPTAEHMKTFGNLTAIEKIEQAVADIDANPDLILGFMAGAPDAALQRGDPKGNRARANISDLGSVIIHDRSGAAVSTTEMARLNFIPRTTDDPPEIKRKLLAMKDFLEKETRAAYETVDRDTRLPSAVKRRFGGAAPPAATAPAAPGGAQQPAAQTPDGQPLYRHKDGQLYRVPEQ